MDATEASAPENLRPDSRQVKILRPDSCDRKPNLRPEHSNRENVESDDSDWVRVERKYRRRRNRNDLSSHKTQSDAPPADDFEQSDSGCGNEFSLKMTTEQRKRKLR